MNHKKTLFSLFLFFLMINSFGQSENKSNPKKYLLLNSDIIEKTDNAKLEVGKVTKHKANPLFGEDNEWEMRFDNLYGNVVFDKEEEIYKCWYCPFIVDSVSWYDFRTT